MERAERVVCRCARCGIEFRIRKQELINGSQKGKYCSMKCYRGEKITKKCLACGKEFFVGRSNDDRKYCSQSCSWKSPVRNNSIGEKHKKLQNIPEFRNKFLDWIKERTASQEWKNSPNFRKGKEHKAYKGNATARETEKGQYKYKKWRADVFGRDNFTCQKCGKKGVYIHAHHIKEWARYPDFRYDVDNGITLCESCHHKEHHK